MPELTTEEQNLLGFALLTTARKLETRVGFDLNALENRQRKIQLIALVVKLCGEDNAHKMILILNGKK